MTGLLAVLSRTWPRGTSFAVAVALRFAALEAVQLDSSSSMAGARVSATGLGPAIVVAPLPGLRLVPGMEPGPFQQFGVRTAFRPQKVTCSDNFKTEAITVL